MTVREDIAKVYVGYFGRSPEPEGFDYWISENNRGFTMPEIAASFSVQEESTSRYPYLANPNVADPGAFVDSVYQNLFNRDPDPAGREFWINELNEAQGRPVAVGAMVLNIISGAQNTEEFGPDLDIINNKTEVALEWVSQTAEVANFVYDDEAAASAKSVLDNVDETEESVETGKQEARDFVENIQGETFTLTDDVDGGSEFVGTDFADTYNATAQTLNTGDDLDGGDGTDTLSVQFGNFQSVSATPRLTDIENIEVQGGARDLNASIDLTTSSGVEKVMLQNVNGEATQNFNFNARVLFEGVGNIVDFDVRDSSTPDGTPTYVPLTDLIVRYASEAVSGDADVQKVFLSNSGLNEFDIEGVEFLEVTAEGVNAVDLFDQARALTVDGSGDLVAGFTTSDTSSTPTATFDSTASTGDMVISFGTDQTVVADAGVGNDVFLFSEDSIVDIDGSAGDDLFLFNFGTSGNLDADDSVEGGDGKDTLGIRDLNSVSVDVINGTSGMEALLYEEHNDRMVASDFDEIDEFIFNGADSNRRTTVEGVESDDLFIFTSDRSAASRALNFEGANVGETLTFELRAGEGDAPGAVNPFAGNDHVEVLAGGNTGSDTSAVFLQDNIASVTIASTGTADSANLIHAFDTDSRHYAINNDNGTSSFTIIGTHDLNIGAAPEDEQSGSGRALGFSEAANVSASGFEGNLTIALSNSADVMVGGLGDDIIYSRGGDDRVTGGEGSDQFRYADDNGTDVILDFLIGEDKIGLSEVDFADTEESREGAILAAEDYVENRNGIDNIGSADAFSVLELQTGLSADQIENDTGAAVQAYVLVYNTTSGHGEIWHDANWSDTNNRDHIATLDTVVDLAGVQAFSNTDFVEFIA
ncbi:MAG: DUF4214 domain-containing protein [Pseudomonadota bacterium]